LAANRARTNLDQISLTVFINFEGGDRLPRGMDGYILDTTPNLWLYVLS
jgi:hypothetical protein